MAVRILFFLGMRKNEFKSENGDEDLLTSQPLVPTKYIHSNKYWIYNCNYNEVEFLSIKATLFELFGGAKKFLADCSTKLRLI